MKKIISTVLILTLVFSLSVNVSAFEFPEPDWGELYYQKLDMVKETEFELYTEAPINTAPYYGAKFEPVGGAYIGSVPEYADKLLPLGSYLTNLDAMNNPDLYYPANVMVKSDDVITMVGWTIYDLDKIDYNFVRSTLATLNSYNKPMFIRFANEMNVSELGDDPEAYKKAFRKAADIIHEFPNLAVVWSPNDMGALDRPFEYFYPGDKYVDWIGVSCYSVKYFRSERDTEYKTSVYFMTGDYSWATNKIKPIIEFMEKNNINKPLMISEGGVATNNAYGEVYESWTTPRLRNYLWYLIMKYPQIKMVNYFDVIRKNKKEKFNISDYPYAVDIFNEAKNSGAYITKYGESAEFVFQPVNKANTLVAENGKVRLYTLAHVPEIPDLQVNYSIDGKWYHAAFEIPFVCNLDISKLSDGKHKLKISTINNEKEYSFYKKGDCIRFGAQPDDDIVNRITVEVDGEVVDFDDQQPIIEDGRTLVPLRAIFEKLNAEVIWDGAENIVTATKDNKTIKLTIGSSKLYVNGEIKTILDVPAKIIKSRTLVPVRAIAESFDCKVEWDSKTRTVIINL